MWLPALRGLGRLMIIAVAATISPSRIAQKQRSRNRDSEISADEVTAKVCLSAIVSATASCIAKRADKSSVVQARMVKSRGSLPSLRVSVVVYGNFLTDFLRFGTDLLFMVCIISKNACKYRTFRIY